MARLRRVVVTSRRVSVRYVETTTRKSTREIMRDMLTEDMIARGFRLSAATPVYDMSGTILLGYRYDVTALI